jgi:hypothetical protein
MADAVKLQSKKVLPARFSLATHVVNEWSVVAEAGTTFEQIKDDPAYWAHVANKLRAADIIHVRSDDSAYYARLYVRSVEKMAANVIVLEFHDFSNLVEMPASIDAEYRVEWAGPHHKFRVVRLKDNMAVQTGFLTKEAAILAMVGQSKAA